MVAVTLIGGQFDGGVLCYNGSATLPPIFYHIVRRCRALDWVFWFSPDTHVTVRRAWLRESLGWRMWRALTSSRPVFLDGKVYLGRQAKDVLAAALDAHHSVGNPAYDDQHGLFIDTLWRVEEDVIEGS